MILVPLLHSQMSAHVYCELQIPVIHLHAYMSLRMLDTLAFQRTSHEGLPITLACFLCLQPRFRDLFFAFAFVLLLSTHLVSLLWRLLALVVPCELACLSEFACGC